jgi:hypothetical protein
VYHSAGFDHEEIIDLCIRVNSVEHGPNAPKWPPCLGLFKSVTAALTYMRRNRTQAEIGESSGVSQPTVSRAISAITPLIPEAVREFVPTADDLDPDAQYILDGTLGDKGYIGNNMITPYRKPAGGELLDWQKEYNTAVNKIRWMIEQVISHFKNWTIMHTDYRRPIGIFKTTISAVVGLHFYRAA